MGMPGGIYASAMGMQSRPMAVGGATPAAVDRSNPFATPSTPVQRGVGVGYPGMGGASGFMMPAYPGITTASQQEEPDWWE
mmetsp:Transcript_41495/g.103580  ORF Transcript_41495/g.103580 Transcript_41495/m.103580 type:complete len:81 (+) Transcript_41495:1-243(+)